MEIRNPRGDHMPGLERLTQFGINTDEVLRNSPRERPG